MLRLAYLVILLGIVLGVAALAQTSTAIQEKDSDKEAKHPEPFEGAIALGMGSGYLGVFLEEVTPERKKELGLSEERGAIVMKVIQGSPAEKGGLKENDVIVSFNGRPVESVRELQRLLGETPAGRQVPIEIIRGGGRQTLTATMAKGDFHDLNKSIALLNKRLQDGFATTVPKVDFNFNFDSALRGLGNGRLGIRGESLTDQLAEFFGVKSGHGVLVSEVYPDSAAARAGVKAGDVIVSVDNDKVDNVGQLTSELAKRGEGAVPLHIIRGHHETTVNVSLEKRSGPRPARPVRPARTAVLVSGQVF